MTDRDLLFGLLRSGQVKLRDAPKVPPAPDCELPYACASAEDG